MDLGFIPFFSQLFFDTIKGTKQYKDSQYLAKYEYTKYDVVIGNFGTKPLILVVSDELLKDFYSNEVSCQETSPMFINLFKKVLGGSLLVSTGDRWKRKRKITSHVFNFNYIKSMYGNYQHIVNKKMAVLPKE